MRELVTRLRPLFVYTCAFSVVTNLLLVVPSLYFLQIYDRVLSSRSNETLLMLSLLAVGSLSVMALLDVLRNRLLVAGAVVVDRHLGPQAFKKMLAEAGEPGRATSGNAVRDVSTLRAFLIGPGVGALFDVPWLPLYVLVIFLFHPILGIVAFAGSVVLILLAYLNERLSRRPVEALQAESRKVGRFADASLRNGEVVCALGMGPDLVHAWFTQGQKATRMLSRAGRIGGSFTVSTKFTRHAVQIAMLGVGAYLVINLYTTAGVIIAATILLGRAMAPVESVVSAWKHLVEARGAWQRIAQLLGDNPVRTPHTALPAPSGALSVEAVVFAVHRQEHPIIRGLSFQISPGEALAVIGPSASGKSTLARLLVGVWKPLSGAVRLDGAEVADWPRETLGVHLGYLPQDVELFAATVSENIARMGRVDAVQVIEAAQRAGAHDMILRLPQGYDSQIGEGGAILSGGQRQQVALARALYGNPRLVVLDEPNANLDRDGERALTSAMRKVKEAGATLVVITHRPSMLAEMDKVLVLREGRAEIFGARGEVMARLGTGIVQGDAPAGRDRIRLNVAG